MFIEKLKEEHEWLEQELQELETIMSSELINYSNLVHVLKKLSYMLDEHIAKEHKLFAVLEKRKIKTTLQNLLDDKAKLKKYHEFLMKALLSGSDFKIRSALNAEGHALVSKLRNHIEEQEWLFCAIPSFEVESALSVRPAQYISA